MLSDTLTGEKDMYISYKNVHLRTLKKSFYSKNTLPRVYFEKKQQEVVLLCFLSTRDYLVVVVVVVVVVVHCITWGTIMQYSYNKWFLRNCFISKQFVGFLCLCFTQTCICYVIDALQTNVQGVQITTITFKSYVFLSDTEAKSGHGCKFILLAFQDY